MDLLGIIILENNLLEMQNHFKSPGFWYFIFILAIHSFELALVIEDEIFLLSVFPILEVYHISEDIEEAIKIPLNLPYATFNDVLSLTSLSIIPILMTIHLVSEFISPKTSKQTKHRSSASNREKKKKNLGIKKA